MRTVTKCPECNATATPTQYSNAWHLQRYSVRTPKHLHWAEDPLVSLWYSRSCPESGVDIFGTVYAPRLSTGPAEPDIMTPSISLADKIERTGHALTADELASVLSVSRITIFKQAKAGRIPSFRIGTCVRFDPKSIADWLRKQ